MVKQIPAVKARQQLGNLLDEVRFRGTDFIIERDGKPIAVVISPEMYGRYQALREHFFDFLDETSKELGEELSQAEQDALINEAAAEVRREQTHG